MILYCFPVIFWRCGRNCRMTRFLNINVFSGFWTFSLHFIIFPEFPTTPDFLQISLLPFWILTFFRILNVFSYSFNVFPEFPLGPWASMIHIRNHIVTHISNHIQDHIRSHIDAHIRSHIDSPGVRLSSSSSFFYMRSKGSRTAWTECKNHVAPVSNTALVF